MFNSIEASDIPDLAIIFTIFIEKTQFSNINIKTKNKKRKNNSNKYKNNTTNLDQSELYTQFQYNKSCLQVSKTYLYA